MVDFQALPLPLNLAVMATAGFVVWMAGTRLSRYASVISDRTGVGQAVMGMLLLAAVSSLPEIAIVITAALDDVAPLAVNNLLGGAALQITLLALADVTLDRSALTHVVAKPSVLLQGALAVLMLALVVAAVLIGDRAVLGIGLWSWGIFAICLSAMWTIARARDAWTAETPDTAPAADLDTGEGAAGAPREDEAMRLATVLWRTGLAAAVILPAGYLLARTGDAIAEQTPLGASFVGAVVLAFCTSLPEISTVYTAVKLRRYVMAVSEIFGTAMFNIALIFLADAFYRGGPVLPEAGKFSGFAALLVIALYAIYMVGLIERRDRTFLRMGIDSLTALLFYFGGLAVLYQLR